MSDVLFSIGDYPVTGFDLLLGVSGLIAFGLLVLIVLVLHGNSRRLAEAAETARAQIKASLDQQISERDGRIRDLDDSLEHQRRLNADLKADAARLTAMMQERDRQNAENLKRFEQARTQMTDEFKLIAADVLKSHGETFSKQNREQVDTLLRPLREKITEFQKEAVEGRTQLSEHLRRLAEDSTNMRTEAQNLTRALKGDTQMQGAWGEMILSSVLERSGLIEGEHYDVQQSYSGEGGRLRTDVEIHLPNDKGKMIVDSKVSLTAFEAWSNSEDHQERDEYLRSHVLSLRNHIKILAGKEYHRHAGSELDFVIMFVPMESAISAALRADPALVDYAFSQNVSLATPTTLLTMLRTVSNIWDIDKRNRNAEEIANRAGKLYDKFAGFLGTMDKLGNSLGAAQRSFDEAKGQLNQGSGNLVRQVQMLQDLGARAAKQIPSGWDSDDDVDAKPDADVLPLLKRDGTDDE
ncbi:MAG: DNA recombination protein RmuC [Hyphomicrobiaceae bacterium]|nr:DNA recombination protein RmuC [Hyphomicrobiaceae bacterium]MCC0022679.1 DNA recombination protein RmuC [Hyphomicrobiaceae bacterium]